MAATQVLSRSSLGLTGLVGEGERGERERESKREREEGRERKREGQRTQLHVHYGIHKATLCKNKVQVRSKVIIPQIVLLSRIRIK